MESPALNASAKPLLGLLWNMPLVTSAMLIAVALLSLSHYIYYDTPADISMTTLSPTPHTGYISRPPLFQFQLEVIGRLFPVEWRTTALSVLHHSYTLIEVYLIRSLLLRCCGKWTALFGAILWALHGKSYVLAHTAQTEPLSILMLIVWLWLASKFFFEKITKKTAINCGVAMGLLASAKSVGIIAIPLFVLAYVIAALKKRLAFSAARSVALACAAAFLTLFLIAGVNYLRLGKFAINEEKGLHLLSRVLSDEQTPLPKSPACTQLQVYADELGLPLFGRDTMWALRNAIMEKTGMSFLETDQFFKKAAMEAWKDRPLSLLWGAFKGIVPSTKYDKAGWNTQIELTADNYERHKEWWADSVEWIPPQVEIFPPRYVEPKLGDAGFAALRVVANGHASNLWRGYYVIAALLVIGLASLFIGNPLLILAIGFSFGNILLSSISEAHLTRFWETSVPAFMIAVLIFSKWVLDRVRSE